MELLIRFLILVPFGTVTGRHAGRIRVEQQMAAGDSSCQL
jgi:hypothetical protein